MADEEASANEARDARLGRIVSDLYDRNARGEPMAEAEVLAAHPDLADDLRRYLGVIRDLGSADGDLEGLIALGVLTKSDDPKYRATLGAYKTIEFIGRGGMGIVLKAYEASLDRAVALKIIRPDLADDKTALERFKREAQAAAALRHPNIVTVHAVGEERGVHLLVMEYVEGPTLAEVIRQTAKPRSSPPQSALHQSPRPESPQPKSPRPWSGGGPPDDQLSTLPAPEIGGTRDSPARVSPPGSPLPTETIRDLFKQLLDGLAAAHAAGLIHRDIKSANLLLDGWPIMSIRAPSASAGSQTDSAQHHRMTRRSRSGLGSPNPHSASPAPRDSSFILPTQDC